MHTAGSYTCPNAHLLGMALLEINLRKPALMEEVVDEDHSTSGSMTGMMGKGRKSQRGGGSAMRKMAMVGAIVALVAAVRAVQSRRSGSQSMDQSKGVEVPIEDGSMGATGGGGQRRIVGIVLAVVGAVVAARRLQGRNRR